MIVMFVASAFLVGIHGIYRYDDRKMKGSFKVRQIENRSKLGVDKDKSMQELIKLDLFTCVTEPLSILKLSLTPSRVMSIEVICKEVIMVHKFEERVQCFLGDIGVIWNVVRPE